jgi:hypothetical protein
MFSVSDSQSETLSGMKLYFDIGIPAGNALVQATMALTPKFVSISPNTGSAGGTVLTANVQGVGIATTELDIVDATGASICQTVKVVSYGVVECLTIA